MARGLVLVVSKFKSADVLFTLSVPVQGVSDPNSNAKYSANNDTNGCEYHNPDEAWEPVVLSESQDQTEEKQGREESQSNQSTQ